MYSFLVNSTNRLLGNPMQADAQMVEPLAVEATKAIGGSPIGAAGPKARLDGKTKEATELEMSIPLKELRAHKLRTKTSRSGRAKVEARIKGEDEYEWFTYTGPSLPIPYRGDSEILERGQIFGVRPSSNGKHIRLVFQGEETKVFTLTPELARKIATHVRSYKPKGK